MTINYQLTTRQYWLNLVPHRPRYVVLCNFDELWIYDFNTQLYEPADRVPVADLPARHAGLNFLFPRAFQPLFGHNWVEVTREAAKDVANAFNSLVFRGEDRVRARRFILQCVVAMFAEDISLLPFQVRCSEPRQCLPWRAGWGRRRCSGQVNIVKCALLAM